MVTVKFNEPSEFLGELKLLADQAEGRILRLTCGHPSVYPTTAVVVLATVLVGTVVLRLESRCGSFLLSDSSEADQVRATAEARLKVLKDAAQELGLEVRAGVYEC